MYKYVTAFLLLSKLVVNLTAVNFYCLKDVDCPSCAAPSKHFCHHGECHCHLPFECDEDSECLCPPGFRGHCDAPHCHCDLCESEFFSRACNICKQETLENNHTEVNSPCLKDSDCPSCAASSKNFCHHGACHCHLPFECDEDSECLCSRGFRGHCDAPHCHCVPILSKPETGGH